MDKDNIIHRTVGPQDRFCKKSKRKSYPQGIDYIEKSKKEILREF